MTQKRRGIFDSSSFVDDEHKVISQHDFSSWFDSSFCLARRKRTLLMDEWGKETSLPLRRLLEKENKNNHSSLRSIFDSERRREGLFFTSLSETKTIFFLSSFIFTKEERKQITLFCFVLKERRGQMLALSSLSRQKRSRTRVEIKLKRFYFLIFPCVFWQASPYDFTIVFASRSGGRYGGKN